LLTKQDFKNEIDNSITNYPAIEARYKISDPVIMQGLDAIATMLSMLSMQLELSTGEVFNKTKKSTVLADAALRGIVNHSTPLRVSLLVNNTGANVLLLLPCWQVKLLILKQYKFLKML